MSKNKTADVLGITGACIAVLGIIGSFVLGKVYGIPVDGLFSVETKYNWFVAIIGIVCSVISGLLLFGLGEIIFLLQTNADNQKQLIASITEIKDKANG